MNVHAYIDESMRGGIYLIGVTTSVQSDLAANRDALRRMRMPGQRRIHFTSESDSRRRKILSGLSGLNAESVVYLSDDRDQGAARAAILTLAVRQLCEEGVIDLTIESRSGQDHRDRSTIFGALGADRALIYRHVSAAEEPMLWVPDAIAWAYGRGGDWRQRIGRLNLVSKVTRI